MLEQFVWHGRPTGPQRFHCPFEVDRVPQHDRSDDEVQPAGAEPLVIEGAILDHTAAVETHRAAQRVLGLALFKPTVTRRRSSGLCSQSSVNSVRSIRPISRRPQANPFGSLPSGSLKYAEVPHACLSGYV